MCTIATDAAAVLQSHRCVLDSFARRNPIECSAVCTLRAQMIITIIIRRTTCYTCAINKIELNAFIHLFVSLLFFIFCSRNARFCSREMGFLWYGSNIVNWKWMHIAHNTAIHIFFGQKSFCELCSALVHRDAGDKDIRNIAEFLQNGNAKMFYLYSQEN